MMIVEMAQQQQQHHQKRHQQKLVGLLPMPLLSVGVVAWFGPWAFRAETRPGAGGGGGRAAAAAAAAAFQGYQSSSRGRVA